jgi:hypothetical protein
MVPLGPTRPGANGLRQILQALPLATPGVQRPMVQCTSATSAARASS